MITNTYIKHKALEIGFDDCGISQVFEIEELKSLYSEWLDNNYHVSMEYLKRNYEKRINPFLVYEKAKSVIVVLKNYYPNKLQNNDSFKISKYAYGADYHPYMKNNLHNLLRDLKAQDNTVKAKVFSDSGVMFEKFWASRAGLGFIGKNSLLINKKFGSFVFLGLLLINKEFEYDKPITGDYCGSCNKCIVSCPNGAINNNRTINCNKCIPFQTIENKSFDRSLNYKGWIYGCDICQDICPYNKKAKATKDKYFEPKDEIINFSDEDWLNLTEEKFDIIFKDSPIERIGFEKFKNNIISIKNE